MRGRAFLAVLALLLPGLLGAVEHGDCPKALDACIAEKQKLFAKRGVLGFFLHRNGKGEPESGTYLVQAVPAGYPAAKAGLQAGDVLLSLKGTPLPGLPWPRFETLLDGIAAGETVPIQARRAGQEKTFRLVAAPPPQDSIDAWISQHVRDHHDPKDYREYLRRLQAAHAPVAASAKPAGNG